VNAEEQPSRGCDESAIGPDETALGDKNMKAKMVAVAGLLVFTGLCGIASAENCKDVTVKVTNNFVHGTNTPQIKVVDFDFWDNADAKWREEFGISNVVINNGKTSTVATRDLEHVGGEKGVRVRVQFKYLSAPSGGWSEILNAESDTFTCKADGPNTVTVVVSSI
jgi:hypothetical protein